jgi:serine protease Do
VAGACLVVAAPLASGQANRDLVEVDDLRELEHAFTQLAQKVRPSAVSIRTYALCPLIRSGAEERLHWPRSHGSGAVIRRDGYILTSTHVIEGADEIVVTMHDGREIEAELVQADQRSDLAVIKIDAQNLRPVRLGDLSRVRQGQWCFVVGNPFGLSNTSGKPALTYGIVSALGRDLNDELNAEDLAEAERRYYGNLIQTSAAINPGNSGGPLFNINGEMTGVVIAIASRSGVNEGTGFAIPVTRRTREIIDLLRRGEQVQYGYLGVEVSDNRAGRRITGDHQAPGAVISGLALPDGPAAKARLKEDDIIIEFEGIEIENTDQLVRVVQATPVGKSAEVVYLRNGTRRTAQVTLAARPISQVVLGEGSREEKPRTCRWRGAWLVEPTAAILEQGGLTRDQFGLMVGDVDPASDADKAGLEARQVVLKLNRSRVRTIEEFQSAASKAGPRVRLEIWSEGTRRTVRMPESDSSS